MFGILYNLYNQHTVIISILLSLIIYTTDIPISFKNAQLKFIAAFNTSNETLNARGRRALNNIGQRALASEARILI